MSRKQSENLKRLWKDPEYREKQMRSRGLEFSRDPVCMIQGDCFARKKGRCTILDSVPKDKCSFRKVYREL